MRLQLGTSIVNNKISKEGKFLKKQVGLNQLAIYSAHIDVPAVITSSCCSLEGIVTPKGVIDKEYIQRFLSNKDPFYADIGVRVRDKGGCVEVIASNPYIKENKLKNGDCILRYDSKKISSASLFMRKVLFSKIGSTHTIKVKRGKEILDFKSKLYKRYGGGAISDTFLEQKGIYFNKNLQIVSLSKFFINYGLHIGDKLVQVNGVDVKNQNDLRKYVENFKNFSSLLFEREDFQFFVNIK
jgi:S1-C subfamily serine protease